MRHPDPELLRFAYAYKASPSDAESDTALLLLCCHVEALIADAVSDALFERSYDSHDANI